MLVVLTGLPGTGKSTLAVALAKALPAAYLSVDPIFDVLEQAPGLDDPAGKTSYAVVRRVAELQVGLGLSAVVDAVNPFEWVRTDYRELAGSHGAELVLLYLAFSSVAAHRERVEGRAAQGRGISWAGVEEQIAYFEPPSECSLRLDAENGIEENLRLALAAVRRSHEASDQ